MMKILNDPGNMVQVPENVKMLSRFPVYNILGYLSPPHNQVLPKYQSKAERK